jgi:hypothetical protein
VRAAELIACFRTEYGGPSIRRCGVEANRALPGGCQGIAITGVIKPPALPTKAIAAFGVLTRH